MKTPLLPLLASAIAVLISSAALAQTVVIDDTAKTASAADQDTSNALETSASASLDYCVPNPVSKSCSIRYSVPTETTIAQLVIQNAIGQIVYASEPLAEGEGTHQIITEQLPDGNYYYTLTADYAKVQTHRMIIAH